VVVGDNDERSDCRYAEIVVDAEYEAPSAAECRVTPAVQRLLFKDGEHFYTTDAAEAASLAKDRNTTLEQSDAWRFAETNQAGSVPFYRCYKDGRHLYTADENCELLGASAKEGRIGYIFSSAVPGTVALHRAYKNGDHFYTIDAAEAKNAVASLRYASEGIVGYVFVNATCQLPPPPTEIACNGKDDNLDGQIDEGSCCPTPGVQRLLSTKGDHFYSTDAGEAASLVATGTYKVEQADAWRFADTNQTGSVPFYRCNKSGLHLYTTSQSCEFFGGQALESRIGYIFPAQAAGTVPLFRLFNRVSGDHFYTISATEAKNAELNVGYTPEGISGYVFADVTCKAPPPPPPPVEIACNGKDDNFDGQIDEGSCCPSPGVQRLIFNANEHFYTTDPAEVASLVATGIYRVEQTDAWRFARTNQPGTAAFYRCNRNGAHLYTIDSNCEGFGRSALESQIGYVFSNQTAGTTPLYRLYNRTNGDHFYTTNAAEAANAVANVGYASEGVSGYVLRDGTCQ